MNHMQVQGDCSRVENSASIKAINNNNNNNSNSNIQNLCLLSMPSPNVHSYQSLHVENVSQGSEQSVSVHTP